MSILSRTLASIPTAGDPGDPEDELSMVCGGHRVVRTDTPLALRRDRQPSSLGGGVGFSEKANSALFLKWTFIWQWYS